MALVYFIAKNNFQDRKNEKHFYITTDICWNYCLIFKIVLGFVYMYVQMWFAEGITLHYQSCFNKNVMQVLS